MAGVTLDVCANADMVIASLTSGEASGVVLDLTAENVDALALSQRCAALPNVRLIAVGPHVHKDRLEAARNAGWQIYTRGQFHRHGPQILSAC